HLAVREPEHSLQLMPEAVLPDRQRVAGWNVAYAMLDGESPIGGFDQPLVVRTRAGDLLDERLATCDGGVPPHPFDEPPQRVRPVPALIGETPNAHRLPGGVQVGVVVEPCAVGSGPTSSDLATHRRPQVLVEVAEHHLPLDAVKTTQH